MSNKIYIERQIWIEDHWVAQSHLLSNNGVSVILAEPGAGKSDLLANLASQFKVALERASLFRHRAKTNDSSVLIVDALDEVAKIDGAAVDTVFVKAFETGAKRVIFASRSGQWDQARTHTLKDCFGEEPQIIRLRPFSEEEQRCLFEAYKPDESFEKFLAGLKKLDLDGLLGNPQFLKMYSDAFVKRGGAFESKRQIFSDAVEQLAGEVNDTIRQSNLRPAKEVAEEAGGIFAKLLVAGSSGVSLSQHSAGRDFPFINALTKDGQLLDVIGTGLFKPSQDSDQHEPVHRIIAEYAAARYFVRRIQDPQNPLSLKRTLSLIAPNSVVRDELRGLLAWMAAEGDTTIQERVIKLDPYAILSNGDPSRLAESSKKKLLEGLLELSKVNPYFRGSDVWRSFSAHGFFTNETITVVRKLLKKPDQASHLTGLLLELLEGSSAVAALEEDLSVLVTDVNLDGKTRFRAHLTLISHNGRDHSSEFQKLLSERTEISLEIAASLVEKEGIAIFGKKACFKLLMSIAQIYFPAPKARGSDQPSRYFITTLIQSFTGCDLTWFLDKISYGLKCTCGAKYAFDCYCRRGRSHIIGLLLDRLFAEAEIRPTSAKIWSWTKALNFKHDRIGKDNAAVNALQNDHQLRRSTQLLAFKELTEGGSIIEMKQSFFSGEGHLGIKFYQGDLEAIVDHAFNTNNTLLWAHFIEHHRPYQKEGFQNPLRAHMRYQSRQKPEFARLWAQQSRAWKKAHKADRVPSFRHSKRMRRRRIQERDITQANQQHFDDNRKQIEDGQHWSWLRTFAIGYLHQNTTHFPEMDDKELPARALRNCFSFLKPHMPTLTELAESSGTYEIVTVAHAACLAEFRETGNLDGIDVELLRAVKTDSHASYTGDERSDHEAFEAEINRLIYIIPIDAENYVREFIEPQLATRTQGFTDAGWLEYRDEFEHLRATLPIEWLERFLTMPLDSAKSLFDVAAQHCDRSRLIVLIERQCTEIGTPPSDPDELKLFHANRDFWIIRQFFFFDEICDESRDWLKENKARLLELGYISGALYRAENTGWPDLSAEKIKLVLEIFVDQWPKVFLPSSYGTGDPPEQTAYRYLTEVIWQIGKDNPQNLIPVVDELSSDNRFDDLQTSLKAIRAQGVKKLALRDYMPPSPEAVVDILDNQKIGTVEDLRVFLVEQLDDIQGWARGGETDGLSYFYEGDKHVDENTATKRIVDRLILQCKALGLSVTIEHQLANSKRCDFTVRCHIDGVSRLLVVEVKGQWHGELYTAAKMQLYERYAVHPDAADQGIYLVLWFGPGTKVAGLKRHSITTASALRQSILDNMPKELHSRIDVIVLDFSK